MCGKKKTETFPAFASTVFPDPHSPKPLRQRSSATKSASFALRTLAMVGVEQLLHEVLAMVGGKQAA